MCPTSDSSYKVRIMVTVGKKGVTCLLCIIQYQPMGFVVAGIIYPKAVGEPGRSTAWTESPDSSS